MAEPFSYRTIIDSSTGEYREKGSKFIAYAYPCDNSDRAKVHIARLWKENPGAVHVCFAWRFGQTNYQDRYSDDGEPANSAGKPIFGQILAHELTNVLIAVVRYYGGTNLGVGGLIQAYKEVSRLALESATIQEIPISTMHQLEFNYDQTGTVMQVLNQVSAHIVKQNHTGEGGIIDCLVPVEFESKFVSLLKVSYQIKHIKIQ